ncbi:MAG: hypothetical protein AAGB51_00510 [Planctomycetota bacterium]
MGATRAAIAVSALGAAAAPAAAQIALTAETVQSINIVEMTGTGTTHSFLMGDNALNQLNGGPSFSSYDFRASTEFYDIYVSDIDGNFDADGSYLSIAADFIFDNHYDDRSGNNIDAVWVELHDGTVLYASVEGSYELGDDLISEEFALNGKYQNLFGAPDTLSTYGGHGVSRFTFGFDNPAVPAPATAGVIGIAAAAGLRRRRA